MRRVVQFGSRIFSMYPKDLAVVSLVVLVSVTAIEMLPAGSTLRFLVALPLLVFLPGYACIALLFPGEAESTDARWEGLNRSLDGVERAGLGFGLSLGIVPLALVAVGAFQPLTLEVVLGTLGLLTLLFAQFAVLSRHRLPPDERYEFNPVARARTVYAQLFGNRGVVGQAATVLLVVGLVAGVGTVTLAVANPPAANAFTEFYVGTENEDGELVTGGYPEVIGVDEPATMTFGVENHEGTSQQYVVVVQLQRVEDGTVVSRSRLDSFDETVPAGGTWQRTHEVAPGRTGDDLRVTYLLYRDDPPERPTAENAYRHLHIWIEVTE